MTPDKIKNLVNWHSLCIVNVTIIYGDSAIQK